MLQSWTFEDKFAGVKTMNSIGSQMRSQVHLAGKFRCRLLLFPCGTACSQGSHVSVFVEACPADDWKEDWCFPDVHSSITALNSADSERSTTKEDKHTFNRKIIDRGWHELIKGGTWDFIERQGWLTGDGELHFCIKLWGESLWNDQSVRLRPPRSMWEEMKFTDCVLCVGDEVKLPCHRAVLAAASEVFDRMLSSDMQEGRNQQVVIGNASEDAVRCFLAYIYTGSMDGTRNDTCRLQDIMILADMYEIPGLQDECAHCILALLSEKNVAAALRCLRDHTKSPGARTVLADVKAKIKQDEQLFDALVGEL